MMTFANDMAEEIGIPAINFRTIYQCFLHLDVSAHSGAREEERRDSLICRPEEVLAHRELDGGEHGCARAGQARGRGLEDGVRTLDKKGVCERGARGVEDDGGRGELRRVWRR
ncbi:hypothetical protein ACMD2_12677 [Ananas comosus]|uniref:Uncharacterized protein n=1 Tax=Ananas comosus TaxID=4615 RepID=A0A199W7U3_ANACO|nr:hypothetical protein ACMD2_12677 [Ananas comosus]